jgi:hypothetical protein
MVVSPQFLGLAGLLTGVLIVASILAALADAFATVSSIATCIAAAASLIQINIQSTAKIKILIMLSPLMHCCADACQCVYPTHITHNVSSFVAA